MGTGHIIERYDLSHLDSFLFPYVISRNKAYWLTKICIRFKTTWYIPSSTDKNCTLSLWRSQLPHSFFNLDYLKILQDLPKSSKPNHTNPSDVCTSCPWCFRMCPFLLNVFLHLVYSLEAVFILMFLTL